jgi:hypothetical protein
MRAAALSCFVTGIRMAFDALFLTIFPDCDLGCQGKHHEKITESDCNIIASGSIADRLQYE